MRASVQPLIAELTSALVAQYYGFDTHIKEDSAAYLKSWLSNLKEDAKLLKRKFRIFIKWTVKDIFVIWY